MKTNSLLFLLACLLIIISGLWHQLPWWSFVVPLFLLGALTSFNRYKAAFFRIGFLAGMLVWLLLTSWYNYIYLGDILSIIGTFIGMHKTIVILLSSLMGGLLSGLAMYAGASLFLKNEIDTVDG
ncbi:hypothetical protein [Ascidiimonas aurantiaca]|uniref:hypothetical protein n=1 Tax=Ascidiimonas aurantiaca TaxID=1685432 RepID=UPI0030EF579C